MRTVMTIIAAAALSVMPMAVEAHDFAVAVKGNVLYFSITDTVKPSVTLTYEGSIAEGNSYSISGEIKLPAMVRYSDTKFAVTAIGPKAFSGATALTSVIIPSTVRTIGDFAFEGCSSLQKIVFPGKDVTFGQGVFFKCTSIRDISFGSDWHSINLEAYRWSDSLRSVRIPAKVTKLLNMKSLTQLEEIDVDANNGRFTSYGGILYNKDGTVLYGVPRSYKGTVRIKEGTTTVTPGALIDCKLVTRIDIAASVTSMSFRETSRMEQLQEIIFRSKEPMTTAYTAADSLLLLQVANADVMLTVAKDSKKAYSGRLCVTAGEYAESREAGSLAYPVGENQLPNVKNINAVKDIDNYE